MKKKIFGVFVSIFVVAMLTLPMSTVCAEKPDKFEVEGFLNLSDVPIMEIMPAGKSDNQIVDVLMPQVWEEDMPGTGIVGEGLAEARWVMHNFDDPEHTWVNVLGVVTITGEVAGVPGTVTIKFSSVSSRGGHWRIIDGTGELANVHGQGSLYPSTQALFEYEGIIHFNP